MIDHAVIRDSDPLIIIIILSGPGNLATQGIFKIAFVFSFLFLLFLLIPLLYPLACLVSNLVLKMCTFFGKNNQNQ